MKKFPRICFLIICLLFSALAFGQTPTPTPKPTPPAIDDNSVVKITTTLIQVDATVLDKNGKSVKVLTADDFEIYENGKKQKITNFSYVEVEPGKSNETPPAKPDKNAPPAPPVPTNLRPGEVRR